MTDALDPGCRPKLVIFDCDGVLIDSEGPCIREIAAQVRQAGIAISDDEALSMFPGMALGDVQKQLEARGGLSLGSDWVARMQARFVTLMGEQAEPIEGAGRVLASLAEAGLPFRVGSNSSIVEMDAKFGRVGFDRYIPRERVHSARELGRPKPDPHVYLHAAAQEGVKPEDCVVIEDSDPGVQAAHDAGMACILLRESGPMPPRQWPGLIRVRHLDEVVPLLIGTRRSSNA
mgnify:CR=1 FL=1